MATIPSPASDGRGHGQARLTFVLLLLGPAVLLVGSVLVISSLFLPWYHSDAHFLVGDPYPGDFQPFVSMQSFSVTALYWLVLAAIPIIAALVSLRIDGTPSWRGEENILASALIFGILTLLAGGVGIISLILYQGFLGLAGTVPHIMDSGYLTLRLG